MHYISIYVFNSIESAIKMYIMFSDYNYNVQGYSHRSSSSINILPTISAATMPITCNKRHFISDRTSNKSNRSRQSTNQPTT